MGEKQYSSTRKRIQNEKPLKPQDVLLPLHNRSVQVLLARTQPIPGIFFGSSHGARLGLVPLCSGNIFAAQCLLLGLTLSLRCKVNNMSGEPLCLPMLTSPTHTLLTLPAASTALGAMWLLP